MMLTLLTGFALTWLIAAAIGYVCFRLMFI